MKRATLALTFLALLVLALPALAQSGAKAKSDATMKADAPKTLQGEVVDTGCYLGHGAKGEKHIECATKCIANGMPMGLLTDDGTLYLITLSHDTADPYNQLKEMAGKRVALTGAVMERGGMKGIDVTAVKLLAAATTK